jgi:hypothetical protein
VPRSGIRRLINRCAWLNLWLILAVGEVDDIGLPLIPAGKVQHGRFKLQSLPIEDNHVKFRLEHEVAGRAVGGSCPFASFSETVSVVQV